MKTRTETPITCRLWQAGLAALQTLALTLALLAGLAAPAARAAADTYLVVDLSGGTNAVSYPVSYLSDVPPGGWTDEHKTTKLVLRKIPAGTFTMGSPTDELGRATDETQHEVTLTKDYYMGVFKVTQRQWELVMGNKPSYFNNAAYYATRPVEKVSYYQIREDPANSDDPASDWPANTNVNANSFMGKLRAKTGFTAFDLPTESQWEYACRARTTTALSSGKNLTNTTSCPNMSELGRYAFNGGNDYTQTNPPNTGSAVVGSYLPNSFGLYDMHGNTFHWCLDWYGAYPGTVDDPKGATSGTGRVIRGGGFPDVAHFCRSASRVHKGTIGPASINPNIGFRLTMTLTDAVADSDLDVLPDSWEIQHFGNLTASNGTGDFDRDGRTDAQELADNTDPTNPGSMVKIPSGTNSGTDPDYGAYSLTVDGFFMDANKVTKAQWDEVYAWAITNGYGFDHAGAGKASGHPVHSINWYDCVKWCNARSEMHGRTPCYTVSGIVYRAGQSIPDCNFSATGYRLPSLIEANYAARGGLSGKRFPWGDTVTHSNANYCANSSRYSYDLSLYTTDTYHPAYNDGVRPPTSPSGAFPANNYGLCDMAGNLFEWCWDASGTRRAIRGGGWASGAHNLRCGDVDWNHPPSDWMDQAGFRAVVSLPSQPATHLVTLHPGDHGDIPGVPSGAYYVTNITHGGTVTPPTPVPHAGWSFTGWNPTIPETITEDFTATAEYEAVPTSTYQLIEGSYSWQQAKADAVTRGGRLACFPTSSRWNDCVAQCSPQILNQSKWWWIGATDERVEGVWEWINGETWSFDAWRSGEPNNGNGVEHYATVGYVPSVSSSVTWNDGDSPSSPNPWNFGSYILEIVGSPPPTTHPDLSLTASDFRILNAANVETANPSVGEALTLEVTLHNTGTAPTSGDILLQVFLNGAPTNLAAYHLADFIVAASASVTESIPAGGSLTLSLPWTAPATADVSTLTAVAEFATNRDASQAGTTLPVTEGSLANNRAARSLQTGTPTPPSGGYQLTVSASAPTSLQSGVRHTLIGTAAYAWGGNNPLLGGTVEVTVNGQTYSTLTSGSDGTWSILLNGLPSGTHTAIITATDGNASGSNSLDLVVADGLPTKDLRVSSLAFASGTYRADGETAWATDGSTVTLTATVRNDGNTPTGAFSLQFKAPNGSTIATVSVPGGLAAFAETTVTTPWTATPAGTHSVSVVCDSTNTIPDETDETNNSRSATLNVTANQADLIVTDIAWSPASPVDGDSVIFTATLRNIGAATIPSETAFQTRFTLNGSLQATAAHTLASALPTHSTVQVSTTLSAAALAGSRSITVEADLTNAIAEISETNNARTQTVTIRAALPDLRPSWQNISGLHFSPANPTVGDPVAILCEVWNAGTVSVPAGSYPVKFTATSGTPWTANLTLTQPLAPGAVATVSTQWISTGSGPITLTAEVDPDQTFTEENEANNTTANSLTVYPPTAGLALGSLASSPAQAYPNSSVTLTATIVNNGGAPSAGGHTVTFYHGGTSIGSQTLDAPIPAKGGSATAQIVWITPADPQTVELFAVLESSKLQQNLVVTANPAPDFAIYAGDILVAPSQPTGGETVTVSADIRHLGGSNSAALVSFHYNNAGQWIALGAPVVVNSATFTGGQQTVTAGAGLVAAAHYYTVRVSVQPQGTSDANTADNTATTSLRRSDAPWANAGSDQPVWSGQTVTLNGSVSTNANIYKWALVSRPPNSNATLSDPAVVSPTFTADVAGTYEVRLIVSDGTIDSPQDTVLITATDGTPTDLALTPTTVAENAPADTVVGTLTGSGGSGSYSYALVTGSGDTDNARFAITNDQLKVTGTLDYEVQPTAAIRVRVTDTHSGNHYEKTFTLALLDDPTEDGDHDGLTDSQENTAGTSRTNPDTDGDGLQDGAEVNHPTHATNPTSADSDGDGLKDKTELDHLSLGLNPTSNQSALLEVITGAIREDTTQQQAHDLYPESAIRNLHVGAPLIKTTNGQIRLELQLQQSDDFNTWTDFGAPAEWTDTPSNKAFYRLFFDSTKP